jgi:uncharacterized protein YxjI
MALRAYSTSGIGVVAARPAAPASSRLDQRKLLRCPPYADAMDLVTLQSQSRFHLHQKLTMMVNRYQVFADAQGSPGELVAFVEQKRMAFREKVTIFTDETKSAVLANFTARKVLDVSGAYDVQDGAGQPLGIFRKLFKQSLLRSTWSLEQPGLEPIAISERSLAIAIFRRIWSLLPYASDVPFFLKYHFDWTSAGRAVGSFTKVTRLRDHYVIELDEPTLDRRLAIAQAVALDALQSR